MHPVTISTTAYGLYMLGLAIYRLVFHPLTKYPGPKSSEKGTIISLLERFFDPQSGRVLVDNHDIKTWNVSNYRSYLSLVSQTLALYEGTIRDNIVLLHRDRKSEDSHRIANAMIFIATLKERN